MRSLPVALLALLAHTGAFLPAADARIDLLDRIRLAFMVSF